MPANVSSWKVRGPAVLAVLFVVVASLQIVATHCVFSQTIDEPVHVATGLEWWQQATYRLHPDHPPLARIAVSLGPHLDGLAAVGVPVEQRRLLHQGTSYCETLSRARLGSLPFFITAAALVWLWTRRLFGRWAALAACGLFATLPPVLAHAGLATTDMAAAATVLGALFAGQSWLEQSSRGRSLILGLAVGLALASKLSAYLFLAVGGLVMVTARRLLANDRTNPGRKRRLVGMAIAGSVAVLVVWSSYRFSVGPVLTKADRPHRLIDRWVTPDTRLRQLAYNLAETSIPAHEHFQGLNRLRSHSSLGHPSYLLGNVSTTGHWAFFPVAVATKTPLPFLALCALGVFALVRSPRRDWRRWAPALCAGAILLAVLPSPLTIGLRHVLPIYPLLSILAGFGCVSLWRSSWQPAALRGLVVALLLWQVTGTGAAHPDYLPWFNELAGDHPEAILIDSDLDWGQDLLRLEDALATHQVDEVSLALFTSADLTDFDFPPYRKLAAGERARGWIAASLMRTKVWRDHAWLNEVEPVARVGASIRLYYLPPADATNEPTESAVP